MANDYDNTDIALLAGIPRMRAEYHACTARALSASLSLNADVARYRLQLMQEQGLVDWNPLAGSLHLTEMGEAELQRRTDAEQQDSEPPATTTSTEPPPEDHGAEPTARPDDGQSSTDPAGTTSEPSVAAAESPAPRKSPAKKRAAKKRAAKKVAAKRSAR